jgi:hypothetical protein
LAAKISVHARGSKIVVEIRTDKASKFTLEPDEAMDLGTQLLKAAYATKSSVPKKE